MRVSRIGGGINSKFLRFQSSECLSSKGEGRPCCRGRKVPLNLEFFIISTHSDIYRYILSHVGQMQPGMWMFLLPFCRIFFFLGKACQLLLSALQWEFNSFVGFQNVSKGKNRQIHAVTQIQKLWEIQRWVDLRFCPRSLPKS